jgi:hypothetical protein
MTRRTRKLPGLWGFGFGRHHRGHYWVEFGPWTWTIGETP